MCAGLVYNVEVVRKKGAVQRVKVVYRKNETKRKRVVRVHGYRTKTKECVSASVGSKKSKCISYRTDSLALMRFMIRIKNEHQTPSVRWE